jgi:hypothetical protein
MVPERLAWAGSVVMSGIGIYLSYRPIANDLGKGLVTALAVLIIAAALCMFPWRRRADGSPRRLINTRVGGHHNPTMIAGERSSQIVSRDGGTFHINRPQDETK